MADGTRTATDDAGHASAPPPERDRREPDYYALLGVMPGASDDEIQRAFRRLAKLWHPDRYATAAPEMRARAERRMRMLIRARDVLADAEERAAYDERRGTPSPGQGARPFPLDYTPPPFYGAGSLHHVEHASANPNGAGQFAGILAAILAIALLGGSLSGGIGSTTGAVLVFGAAGLLLLAAAVLFTSGSGLAHAATSWMEGEPGGGANSSPEDETAPTPEQDADAPRDTFERLVEEALASVPEQFQSWLENVMVEIEDEPSEATLAQMRVRPDCTLFGLYQGVPLTHHYGRGVAPEVITIFQGPIERYCHGDGERIREQARRTVLHELAHHFGMDHDAMPTWIR
jgi:predicted Zn-dependent protease with MMP-like domain